jgi:hypothetical protein
MEVEIKVGLQTISCYKCGCTFGMPNTMYNALKESHENFWCPSGHQQHFIGETEAERLRKKLHAETLAKEKAMREAAENELSLAKALRKVKSITKRANAGVCPYCPRTFGNLARHISCKHPEEVNGSKTA